MRIELNGALSEPCFLAELLGATIKGYGDGITRIVGMATSSHEVQRGDVFIALQGERSDGNDYVPQALEAGAVGVLSAKRSLEVPRGVWHFQCADTENALLAAAGKWRDICGAFVVGVTGSAGKTTTKDSIAAVLGDVPHNAGNYNSTVGMPLSVLSFPKSEFWVCELGINHVGEMEKMSRALRPDLGVITNVGSAHIGHFGDFSTLVGEKFKLCEGIGRNGALVVPISLKNVGFPVPLCHVFSVGEGETADFSVENIAVGAFGTRCDLHHGKREITNLAWPIPGVVGKSVLGLCAAVGMLCGRSEAQIRAGLEKAAHAPMHSKAYAAGEMLFFEDCYNASPEACLAALEGLCLLAGARPRVAVLGDMLELGAYSGILHRTLGASVYKSGVDYLFTYGALAAQIARGAKEAGMAASRIFSFAVGEEQLLAKELHARVPADAAVLYKASRALCMERVIEEVRRFV